jgi:hypothetical protein
MIIIDDYKIEQVIDLPEEFSKFLTDKITAFKKEVVKYNPRNIKFEENNETESVDYCIRALIVDSDTKTVSLRAGILTQINHKLTSHLNE